jgi:hypothetical protein
MHDNNLTIGCLQRLARTGSDLGKGGGQNARATFFSAWLRLRRIALGASRQGPESRRKLLVARLVGAIVRLFLLSAFLLGADGGFGLGAIGCLRWFTTRATRLSACRAAA